MADVYYVSIGERRTTSDDGIHGSMQVFDDWAKLVLIDGRLRDRWHSIDGHGFLPRVFSGEWTYDKSTRLVKITEYSGAPPLVTFAAASWPMTAGMEGKATIKKGAVHYHSGAKTDAIFYVQFVE